MPNCKLISRKEIRLSPGAYFETVLDTEPAPAAVQRRSEYPFGGHLAAGDMIAVLGDCTVHEIPRRPAGLPLTCAINQPSIYFELHTNVFLSPGMLGEYLAIFLESGVSPLELPLNSPCIELFWVSRGTYSISVRLPA